jgi:hypothetical protein
MHMVLRSLLFRSKTLVANWHFTLHSIVEQNSVVIDVGLLQHSDGRLGSRLRGYHAVAPRPLRYGPFVHRL